MRCPRIGKPSSCRGCISGAREFPKVPGRHLLCSPSLTVNQGRIEPYALGDAYGHLAVSVDELKEEHERLTKLGLNPGRIVELNRDGKLFALFFFLTDPDGYKIEVLQRHGRFQ